VFELSRDLYRELKPMVILDTRNPGRTERLLLAACERTVARLAGERRGYDSAARALFSEVRFLFPVQQQLNGYRIIERRLSAALDVLAVDTGSNRMPWDGLRCAAMNRRGKPCRRTRLRGMRYCPSHKHLEVAFRATSDGVSAA